MAATLKCDTIVADGSTTNNLVLNTDGSVVLDGTTTLNSAGAGTITFPAVTGVVQVAANSYTWPAGAGTNGQVLTTNGAGVLSWSSAGSGSGTVNSGTLGQLAYYAAAGTAVSGTAAGTGVITALGNAVNTANGIMVANASGVLAVAQGGTGAATLTANGVLLGNGTSAVSTATSSAAGQILQGNGSGSAPTWTATPTLGVAGTTAGTLTLAGSTSGATTISASAVAGTTTATVPARTGNLMMDGPAFAATMGAASLALTNNVATVVPIDSVDYDTNSNFNSGTYRFTATIPGYYQFTGQAYVSNSINTSANNSSIFIRKNGTQFFTGASCSTQAGLAVTNAFVSALVRMNAGDYVELVLIAACTGGVATILSGSGASYLQGVMVRGA
jgi:hypothetical protein